MDIPCALLACLLADSARSPPLAQPDQSKLDAMYAREAELSEKCKQTLDDVLEFANFKVSEVLGGIEVRLQPRACTHMAPCPRVSLLLHFVGCETRILDDVPVSHMNLARFVSQRWFSRWFACVLHYFHSECFLVCLRVVA